MKVLFTRSAWTDYLYWQNNDGQLCDRINALIGDIERAPFRGIGKPEPLRDAMQGWWSRRINREYRLVYRLVETGDNQRIEILAGRHHYIA